ncbi:hypothetical protein PI125_g8031 [Phytophthora idaei]|nr:hypothetical protein PI125_g8031 [Phytophthora idaei]KAG3159766.1 hypothetical protein PI126_g7228 [Phytophthora idaei]
MVVLAARKEHLQAWHTTVKYWYGSGVELKWTGSRAWFVVRVCWTVVTLVIYATFYGVLFVYEIIEGACLGWPGVVILTLTMYYQFVDDGDVMEVGGVALDRGDVIPDAGVLVLGVASHVWRWYEYTSGGRQPMTVAQDCYADWIRDMEEREQPD